ncbi:MAG: Mini-ribonuclease 3 [Clostridiales bacterium]|nr:Mini-ribonuclease 3 [Clostridiales bacterium]
MMQFLPKFSINPPLSDSEALKLNPITLAFIGDCVHTLYERTRAALENEGEDTNVLNALVAAEVKAVSQAKKIEKALPTLSETESEIFRKARNAKIHTSAKHASIGEYRYASGFEAVIGYLYLTGKTERLFELLEKR